MVDQLKAVPRKPRRLEHLLIPEHESKRARHLGIRAYRSRHRFASNHLRSEDVEYIIAYCYIAWYQFQVREDGRGCGDIARVSSDVAAMGRLMRSRRRRRRGTERWERSGLLGTDIVAMGGVW